MVRVPEYGRGKAGYETADHAGECGLSEARQPPEPAREQGGDERV